MFSFFQPRYRKEARHILKNARKLLHHKRDQLSESAIADLENHLRTLEGAVKTGDERAVKEATDRLDAQWSSFMPQAKDAAWRENVEVFLVAVVVALGVRTYFLQPFTIPTGSMQPTLNGIIGHRTSAEPPNPLLRAVEFVLHGRKYLNTVATADDEVLQLADHTYPLLSWTTVICANSRYTIFAPADTLQAAFNIHPPSQFGPGTQLRAGQVIARGYVDTGDHVFVDKFTYNFRAPRRSDVFVFSTAGIQGIENALQGRGVQGSQFYIKRLAGTPGDNLRIAEPQLFINGQLAPEAGFQRVMSQKDGYRGYFQGPISGLMGDPGSSFTLPPHTYFALGDNSGNSLDGRYWGTVPEENLMGRALFVYWPFIPHWGLIR